MTQAMSFGIGRVKVHYVSLNLVMGYMQNSI